MFSQWAYDQYFIVINFYANNKSRQSLQDLRTSSWTPIQFKVEQNKNGLYFINVKMFSCSGFSFYDVAYPIKINPKQNNEKIKIKKENWLNEIKKQKSLETRWYTTSIEKEGSRSTRTWMWLMFTLLLLLLFFFNLLGTLLHHRSCHRNICVSGRRRVNMAIETRGAFSFYPTLKIVLSMTQDPTTWTKPANHSCYDSQYSDHCKNCYHWSNRPMTSVSVGSLLAHFHGWCFLLLLLLLLLV